MNYFLMSHSLALVSYEPVTNKFSLQSDQNTDEHHPVCELKLILTKFPSFEFGSYMRTVESFEPATISLFIGE